MMRLNRELVCLSALALVLMFIALVDWLLLRSIRIALPYNHQIEHIVLVTADDNLTRLIEDAVHPEDVPKEGGSLRGTSMLEALLIIEDEANASGVSLQDWLGDREQWVLDQSISKETSELGRSGQSRRLSGDYHAKERRRLNEEGTGSSTPEESDVGVQVVSQVLPPLILATAGLVIVCAFFLCCMDARGHVEDRDDDESSDDKQRHRQSTLSASSSAQNSYVYAVIAARNPVLPPVDCVIDDEAGCGEAEDPLSPISSVTASVVEDVKQSTSNVSELDEDEQRDDHDGKSVGETDRVDHKDDDKKDVTINTRRQSASPDRSVISTLTEFSQDQDKGGMGEAPKEIDDNWCVDASIQTINQSQTLVSGRAKVDIVAELAMKSSSATKENHSSSTENSTTESVSEANTSPTEHGPEDEGNKLQESSKEEEGPELVSLPSSCPDEPANSSTSSHEENKTTVTHTSGTGPQSDEPDKEANGQHQAIIRDVVLVGDSGSLGLETGSSTSENQPVVTHVSPTSPLVGTIFEGDIILNVSDSYEERSAKKAASSDEHSESEDNDSAESPRCIQFTVLSFHDEEASQTKPDTHTSDDASRASTPQEETQNITFEV